MEPPGDHRRYRSSCFRWFAIANGLSLASRCAYRSSPHLGCHRAPYACEKVSGKVAYEDGSLIPAERIRIVFVSQKPPIDPKTGPRNGAADADPQTGKFDFATTYTHGDGIISGEHKVFLQCLRNGLQTHDLIADEYADPARTPLLVRSRRGAVRSSRTSAATVRQNETLADRQPPDRSTWPQLRQWPALPLLAGSPHDLEFKRLPATPRLSLPAPSRGYQYQSGNQERERTRLRNDGDQCRPDNRGAAWEGSKTKVPPASTVKFVPLGRAALLFTISVPASTVVPPV